MTPYYSGLRRFLLPQSGKTKDLANVFFALNLLAFLIHTAQHLVNEAYRLLRETLSVRRTFFNDLKALTRYMVFDSWEALFAFMIDGLELDIPPP